MLKQQYNESPLLLPLKPNLILDRKGLMGWVCLSVCPSVRHASTAACKTICLKEIKKASRNAERFAGSYDITLYTEYF
jgi:hypothetical protein